MPSRSNLIPHVRDILKASLLASGTAENECEPRFCVAVGEALANAVFHGNLEVSSSLKGAGGTSFADAVAAREQQSPYRDRKVTILEQVSPDGVQVTISDEGAGFDVPGTLAQLQAPEELRSSGRGISMMQGLADELHFSQTGSVVTLVFHTGVPQSDSSTAIGRLPAGQSGPGDAV
jgi:anti-sigma regulatory factor (Ser/Thr protein kinase)